jgi:aerobic C4-dicarboxylate transport protein
VASWEGDIDREKAHRVLNGEVAAIDMETPVDAIGIDASGAQLQTS